MFLCDARCILFVIVDINANYMCVHCIYPMDFVYNIYHYIVYRIGPHAYRCSSLRVLATSYECVRVCLSLFAFVCVCLLTAVRQTYETKRIVEMECNEKHGYSYSRSNSLFNLYLCAFAKITNEQPSQIVVVFVLLYCCVQRFM